MAKRKRKEITSEEVVSDAIFRGINTLRNFYGIEMNPQILFNYLEKDRISDKEQEIYESDKFQKLESDREKAAFLGNEIFKYVVEKKPFDKKGQRLLEGSLESKVGFLGKVFSTKKRREKIGAKALEDYRKRKRIAEDISEEVTRRKGLYAKVAPKLVEAVGKFGEVSGKSALSDILYAEGELERDKYFDVKSAIGEISRGIIDFTRNYVKTPAIPYATAIIGILLILIFNSTNVTGAIIGTEKSFSNPFLFFTGIGLFCISCLAFIFRNKLKKDGKTKKRKKK